MRTVLVTGGAGFIGANFVHHLLRERDTVSVITLDALTYAGSRANLPDATRHTFVHGNICDTDLVIDLLRTYHVDTIVNFAAETHVDRSLVDPTAFLQSNVLGVASLLSAARQVWLAERLPLAHRPRFHQVSTDEVYGDLPPDAPASRESDPYHPSSPYAASKASADHLVWSWRRSYGLPVSAHHAANTYGPRQFPEKLLPLFVFRALREQTLPVYGDGHQIRDWLHVADHCSAVLSILDGPEGRRWNVSSGIQVRNLDLIEGLCAALDQHHPRARPHRDLIRHVADRPGHDRRYAVDAQALRSELGWAPRISWRQGLVETVRWYLSHPDWIDGVRSAPAYRDWMQERYGT